MARLVHIVDDKAEVRAGLSFMLRQHGYDTQSYTGGAELLAAPRLERGCILLDVQMPDMDGFEVLAELAKRGAGLPIIMLTGHGDIGLAVQALKRGAVDFLEKPYEPEALVQAIARAFTLSDRNESARRTKAEAVARLKNLGRRETQILQGLQAGMSNKAMARWLGLSPRTVESYRSTMMAKLGVRRLSHALHIALDGGLPAIEIEPDREYG